MKKVFSYILGSLFVLIGIAFITENSILGGLLTTIGGLFVIPPLKEKIKSKYPIWNNSKVSLPITIGIFLIGCFIGIGEMDADADKIGDNKNKSKNEGKELYQSYIEKMESDVANLQEDRKAYRAKALEELKENEVYIDLVTNKTVSAKHLPIFHAIADGVSNITNDRKFAINEKSLNTLEKLENKEEALGFALTIISLSISSNGGIPKEAIEVFERYKNRYRLYGVKGIVVDGNQESIKYDYDLTPIFCLLEPQNKSFLNAVYEAKDKGITDWSENAEDLKYPHVSNAKEYGKYMLSTNPYSKILPKGINANFWNEYDPIVRERALEMFLRKDCNGLQKEFNTTANHLEVRQKTGKDGSRNLSHMNFLDTQLKKLGCYKD